MFKEIADENIKQRKDNQKRMKELETKIVDSSLPTLCDSVLEDISTGSEQIVKNQKAIDKKCRAARDNWEKFNNELEKWGTQVTDLNKAIRDIEDIREWSESLQKQVDAVCAKLEAK